MQINCNAVLQRTKLKNRLERDQCRNDNQELGLEAAALSRMRSNMSRLYVMLKCETAYKNMFLGEVQQESQVEVHIPAELWLSSCQVS